MEVMVHFLIECPLCAHLRDQYRKPFNSWDQEQFFFMQFYFYQMAQAIKYPVGQRSLLKELKKAGTHFMTCMS